MATRIFLDPDGTQEFGLFLIVGASTGITYSHQCAGYATEERTQEGFLIPLGGSSAAKPLMEFFWKEFKGHSYPPTAKWTEDRVHLLRELIEAVAYWKRSDVNDEDERLHLKLDDARLSECTEGWIPVASVYGPGILVFENCD